MIKEIQDKVYKQIKIHASDAISIEAIINNVDRSKIVIDRDLNVFGVREQILEMRKDKPHLFKRENLWRTRNEKETHLKMKSRENSDQLFQKLVDTMNSEIQNY